MMTALPRVNWLRDETVDKILDEAVGILEQLGVLVESDDVLSLLDSAGAAIDGKKRRAFIPSALVHQALATAPKRVVIYDRSGEPAMDLGGDRLHFNPGSAALRIYDHQQGRARVPTTGDLVALAVLTDALPNYAAQSTAVIAGDVPTEIADRYRLYLALRFCAKPVVTGTFRADAFGVMHEMLAAVAGSPEKLRHRPMAIFDCCPSPPLTWSRLTVQALVDCAQNGIPAELISMPFTGATAPVTLAGAVTQHCAENLSGLVIHQIAAQGAPLIWGGSPGCFDMRNTTTPMGAVETHMINGACVQVGRYLGLPTHAYLALSDAKLVDYQAGMETGMGAMTAALSGVNNVSGPGMLDFESCQSLEKLVLDHEVCGMALRLARGIELRDEPLARPLIAQCLESKDFISLPHTANWFRKEVYFPDPVIERGTAQQWESKGSLDAVQRAAARVQRLLGQHQPEPLPSEVVAHLEQLMANEARNAGLDALPVLPR